MTTHFGHDEEAVARFNVAWKKWEAMGYPFANPQPHDWMGRTPFEAAASRLWLELEWIAVTLDIWNGAHKHEHRSSTTRLP